MLRAVAEPCGGFAQSGLGDVEHGEIDGARVEEAIDEEGSAAANIENGCSEVGCSLTNEAERCRRVRLVLADLLNWP